MVTVLIYFSNAQEWRADVRGKHLNVGGESGGCLGGCGLGCSALVGV